MHATSRSLRTVACVVISSDWLVVYVQRRTGAELKLVASASMPEVVIDMLLMQPTAVPFGVAVGGEITTVRISAKITHPDGGGLGTICWYKKR